MCNNEDELQFMHLKMVNNHSWIRVFLVREAIKIHLAVSFGTGSQVPGQWEKTG